MVRRRPFGQEAVVLRQLRDAAVGIGAAFRRCARPRAPALRSRARMPRTTGRGTTTRASRRPRLQRSRGRGRRRVRTASPACAPRTRTRRWAREARNWAGASTRSRPPRSTAIATSACGRNWPRRRGSERRAETDAGPRVVSHLTAAIRHDGWEGLDQRSGHRRAIQPCAGVEQIVRHDVQCRPQALLQIARFGLRGRGRRSGVTSASSAPARTSVTAIETAQLHQRDARGGCTRRRGSRCPPGGARVPRTIGVPGAAVWCTRTVMRSAPCAGPASSISQWRV